MSRPTLLGPVEHVTSVEAFWFDRAVTGRSLTVIGVAATPDRSFAPADDDTIAPILEAHRRRCRRSQADLAAPAWVTR